MKNKGFVLMETIVVIVVISVSLLTIFSSYNKILRKVKTENKYDTSEYIYMTEHIKKYMKENSIGGVTDIFPCDIDETTGDITSCDELTVPNYLDDIPDDTISNFNVKKIHILSDINNFDKKMLDGTKNSEKFDAYMIDYIRKLDVGVNDKLIIVEYQRPALKTNGTPKKMYYYENGAKKEKDLYETYIASLEWRYET